MRHLARGWLLPLVWMGLIFVVSAQPQLPHAGEPWLDLLIKKTGHALAYGILAWLYLRPLGERLDSAAVARIASVTLAVVYAASDEYHQTFVPGRSGRLTDVGIDCLGACGAMLLDWRQRPKAQAAPSPPAADAR